MFCPLPHLLWNPMFRKSTLRSGTALFSVVALIAGCRDLPTEQRPPLQPSRGSAPTDAASGAFPGREAYGCNASERATGFNGYRYTHGRITFPARELAPGSKGIAVKLVFQDPSTAPRAVVRCYIPASDAALRRVVGLFVRGPGAGVPPTSLARGAGRPMWSIDRMILFDPKRRGQSVAPTRPSFDTGCVMDGICSLPPIGSPVPAYSYPGYYWGGGDGWATEQSAGSYYHYDGEGYGEGSDPGVPPEEVADDENSICHSAQSSACNLEPPTNEQRGIIQRGIQKMKTSGVCGLARTSAQSILDSGNFQVWTDTVRNDAGKIVLGDADKAFLYPDGIEMYAYIHLWTGDLSAWTIAHEALHSIGYHHEDVIDGMKMDQYAHSCVS
jgi:hypothetical protein